MWLLIREAERKSTLADRGASSPPVRYASANEEAPPLRTNLTSIGSVGAALRRELPDSSTRWSRLARIPLAPAPHFFVKPAVTVWMSDNHFSREGVRSAHSVIDVRPLRRPTAEVELRAAEPALDCLAPELRDRDW